MLETSLLTKTINETNYFEKQETGCVLYSFNSTSQPIIITTLESFDIPQSFAISGKALNLVKTFKECEIELQSGFRAFYGEREFSDLLVNYEKAPITLENELPNAIEIEIEYLKKAIDFVGSNEARPILTGININQRGDIIATDSYIIYRYINNNPIIAMMENNYNITLPKDFVSLICKEFDTDKITIKFDNAMCVAEYGNTKIVSRLINGNYPQVANLFGKNNESFTYQATDLKSFCDIAKQLSGSIIQVVLSGLGDNVLAIGENQKYEDVLECKTTLSEALPQALTLSLNQLLLVLKHKASQDFVIELTDHRTPVEIKDGDCTYLLLPIISRG